jgi:acetolactate decarboxylase
MLSHLSKKIITLACFSVVFNIAFAQKKQYDNLYSAGYAASFISGLYDVYFPYKQIMQHGDFGLGAPNDLDGELLIFNGVPYQTRYTGKTTVITEGTAPYAINCYFKADKTLKPGRSLSRAELYKYLDSVTTNLNGMYAIHVKGKFSAVKTRAFPPVEKPYKPMVAFMDKQVFFDFKDVQGDLVGFKLPAFMSGPFISGYHFHFLSDDKQKGGHIIEFTAQDIVVELDELTSYSMDLPQTEGFRNFDLKTDRKDDIKSVENGKK